MYNSPPPQKVIVYINFHCNSIQCQFSLSYVSSLIYWFIDVLMSWAIDVWICGLMVVWIYRSTYLWINWLTKPATEEYTNNALTKTTLLFRKRACFDQNKHVLETCLFKACLFLMKVLIKTSMFRSMPVLMPVLIKTGMFRNMRVLFRNMPVLMRVSK